MAKFPIRPCEDATPNCDVAFAHVRQRAHS